MKKNSKTICILLGIAVMCILLCLLVAKLYIKQVNTVDFIQPDHVREEYLVIEGLEKEYELLFLTDTHVIVQSEEDDAQVTANADGRYPVFMDAIGVSAAEQFPYWMKYANEREVDAVLFGGDIIDYPSAGNLEHLQKNLDTLTQPYIYTLGNHDWTYPWEYMTDKGEEEYLPLLEPMMQGNTAIQRLDVGELTIVAVDNSSNQVNPKALEAYEEILAEDRPTIVLVHVPFFAPSLLEKAVEEWNSPVVIGSGNAGGIYENEETTAFMKLTTAADSPVVAVLAGHVHFYNKDYMNGEKEVLQLVGDAGFKRQGMRIHISGASK